MSRPAIWMACAVSVILLRSSVVGQDRFVEEDVAATAAAHVETALAFRIDGNKTYSDRLLKLALRTDPDSRAARWHLGQVQVDDKWLDVRARGTDPGRREKEQKYRTLRDKSLGDPKMEAGLAKWSKRNGFPDRSKLHYRRVLGNELAQPQHMTEAMRHLDLHWFDGQLKSGAEIAKLNQQEEDINRALKKGRPQLEEWRNAIENSTRRAERAFKAVRAIEDAKLIPVMESFVEDSGELFGNELVEALGRLRHSHTATKSLIQFSVLSPWEAVRRNAAVQLRDRSLNDVVPILIKGLNSPVASRFNISRDGRGNVRYRHEVLRRDADSDRTLKVDHVSQHQHVSRMQGQVLSVGPAADLVTRADAERDEAVRLARLARMREKEIQASNQRIQSANATVYDALETVTETNVARSPHEWRQWWGKYYTETMGERAAHEYYQPSSSVYYTFNELEQPEPYDAPTVSAPQAPRFPAVSFRSTGPPASTSCFAEGTPVWTDQGLVTIESIRVGDRVLSQNPETGELAYKVVLVPTAARPSTGIHRITVNDDAVRLTRSHELWKINVGWQMAKQLKVGDRLYGLEMVEVREIEEWPEAQLVYNLVVDDFHTYFVGSAGLFVHDITARQPAASLVPGLMAGELPEQMANVETR